MTSDRRDFLKIGSAGLAACLVNSGLRPTQATVADVAGELEGGTGSLRLEGPLKSRTLILEAHDFIQGQDRTVINHGTFDTKRFYSALFSHNLDQTVIAFLRDEDHSTTLVLSDTDVAEIGRLIVWHDSTVAKTFQIKKKAFLDGEVIVDENGTQIDFLGKRKPPDFTAQDLEVAFGDNPALLKFMRGKRSHHHPTADQQLQEWICFLLSMLKGCTFSLIWALYT